MASKVILNRKIFLDSDFSVLNDQVVVGGQQADLPTGGVGIQAVVKENPLQHPLFIQSDPLTQVIPDQSGPGRDQNLPLFFGMVDRQDAEQAIENPE